MSAEARAGGVFRGGALFPWPQEVRPFANALMIFIFAWSVFPPATAPNPPLDSVEQLAWGASWRLGYYKHPPLVAWLYSLTTSIGVGSWAFMWLSAAAIAIAHVCVWRAARHVVDPYTALWSSALLQAIWLHNYFIPEFNQNVALIPFFAAAGLFAIRALKYDGLADWLALGAVTGAGLLTKYEMGVSALVIALFFVAEPTARKRLRQGKPYYAAALALLIFSPHLLWLSGERGAPLTYALHRGAPTHSLAAHFVNFAECLGEGALVLLAPVAFIAFGRGPSRSGAPQGQAWAADGDRCLRRLVLALAFAPILATALIALLAGVRIKTAWTAAFWEFAPLALLLAWRVDVRVKTWARAGWASALVAALALVGYCGANLIGPSITHKPMRVHFPGPQLANEVAQVWAAHEGPRPLRMIIGDTFIAGSAAYFEPDRPLVRIDDDGRKSPWAPDALKRQAGAVIVWDIVKEGAEIPLRFRAQNPGAVTAEIVTLPFQTRVDLPTARLGIAIVGPSTP